ncbi:hypothetical protein DL89DRAFT_296140 [Linderina pennispora]|uniref:Uncharacterized protein n=1 Tax=Linderina pennispora TaxID=61395 RepID=A0A1Y1VW38_9FUNG|nr:uncharacterized protein DL89DRAFT_296140 [Linderina pennispora]ORX65509.1 hypothetical protein DL89DRAFT_296140 [Linderina pennispora]
MDPEYRSIARILATSRAPNIIAEVTQDLLVRWPLTAMPLLAASRQLELLGQYIATLRVRAYRNRIASTEERARLQRNAVDRAAHWLVVGAWQREAHGISDQTDRQAIAALFKVAERSSGLPALALLAGVLRAMQAENVVDPLVEQCAVVLANVVRELGSRDEGFGGENGTAALIMATGVVDAMAPGHVRMLAGQCAAMVAAVLDPQSGVLGMERIASQEFCRQRVEHVVVREIGGVVRALTVLIDSPALALPDAARIPRLLAYEQAAAKLPLQLLAATVLAALHVLEAVLQRYFIDDAGPNEQLLVDLWVAVVDAMACVHFATLAGPAPWRSGFIVARPPRVANAAVRRLFHSQPCLLYMAARPVWGIHAVRSCTVLFYMDLLEHLVGRLANNTLMTMVLPLVTRYADSNALQYAGPDWFESAHAVVLAVLEAVNSEDSAVQAEGEWRRAALVVEVVPWYTDLLLELYPGRGISGELLLIAYTAAVRAATAHSAPVLAQDADAVPVNLGYALAWERVEALERKIDAHELMLVLLELLTAVPLELLPKLMDKFRVRWEAEPEWAMRRALLDAAQDMVVERAELARKPALAMWTWKMRTEFNAARI